MARDKTMLGRSGLDVHYAITETFTHRLDTPDGRILRGDPGERFWSEKRPRRPAVLCGSALAVEDGASSWYGDPTRGWDSSLAVEEPHTRRYDGWWDVS